MERELKPTQAELERRFSYDPETGVLTRKDYGVGRQFRRGGKVAGWVRSDGYVHLQMGKEVYYAHCVIWCLMTGKWPALQIDHKNRDRHDNRWGNLRLATPSENKANIVARNPLNAKGIEILPNGKFRARVRSMGKTYHLGCFIDLDEAKAAYAAEAIVRFGEFARS